MQQNAMRMIIAAFLVVFMAGSVSLGQTPTPFCDDDGGPEICVQFDNLDDQPLEDEEFRFDFSNPNKPSVELRKGSAGEETREWRVWCWDDDENKNPQNIGSITADGAWNYEVLVAQVPTGYGAADLGSVTLPDPEEEEYWGDLGILIEGELGGMTVRESDMGQGGRGSITAGTLDGDVTIDGNAKVEITDGGIPQGVTVTVGQLDARYNPMHFIEIDGDLAGTVNVKKFMSGNHGYVDIGQDITNTGRLNIQYMMAWGIRFQTYVKVNGDCDGDIRIGYRAPPWPRGVDTKCSIEIYGTLDGKILSGVPEASPPDEIDMAGIIEVGHGGDGVIQFGAIKEDWPGEDHGKIEIDADEGEEFSGKIKVKNVEGDATISIERFSGTVKGFGAGAVDTFSGLLFITHDFKEDGTIKVDDLLGTINLRADDNEGDILVFDTMTGKIKVGWSTYEKDFSGDIDVENDMEGEIEILGELEGDISVGGDVTQAASVEMKRMTSTGRILIDGECHGAIVVQEDTVANSLIRMISGLYSGGTIEVNASEDEHDANGIIQIGNPWSTGDPQQVTFDGCIRVYDEDPNGNTGEHGNLGGYIYVNGCHTTGHDLNICIDGDVTGGIVISQEGCQNQVGHSCGICPPP